MISVKTADEILKMRNVGKISALVLEDVCSKVAIGVSTQDLNDYTKIMCLRSLFTSLYREN